MRWGDRSHRVGDPEHLCNMLRNLTEALFALTMSLVMSPLRDMVTHSIKVKELLPNAPPCGRHDGYASVQLRVSFRYRILCG